MSRYAEITITKRNDVFQEIQSLKSNKEKRNEKQTIFVEGVRNIKLALKYKWNVRHWIYSDYNSLSDWAKATIKDNQTNKNFCFSAELLSEISGKIDSSELIALFEMKKRVVQPSKKPFIILFDRPSKKGNLGSMIRSADAFGADGLYITGHSVDMFDPEVIGSSMGSFFALDIERLDSNEQIAKKFDDLKQQFPDLQIVGATELGDENIRQFDFNKPTIMMIGNEAMGLNKYLLSLSDKLVKIPMVGEASSFNASCSGSIFMYEIFTQRK